MFGIILQSETNVWFLQAESLRRSLPNAASQRIVTNGSPDPSRPASVQQARSPSPPRTTPTPTPAPTPAPSVPVQPVAQTNGRVDLPRFGQLTIKGSMRELEMLPPPPHIMQMMQENTKTNKKTTTCTLPLLYVSHANNVISVFVLWLEGHERGENESPFSITTTTTTTN